MVASATLTIARSRTTMNCAATMRARAVHRLPARGKLIEVSVIHLLPRSWRNSTIAHHHARVSYTSRHDRNAEPSREVGSPAAARAHEQHRLPAQAPRLGHQGPDVRGLRG